MIDEVGKIWVVTEPAEPRYSGDRPWKISDVSISFESVDHLMESRHCDRVRDFSWHRVRGIFRGKGAATRAREVARALVSELNERSVVDRSPRRFYAPENP